MKNPLLLSFLLSSWSHGAVITLAKYEFTHASGSLPAGWNSDSALAAHVTATDVGIVGASFANNTANVARFTDTATTSFTVGTNYFDFQLSADTGYYFDLTDPLTTISFGVDRVSGDSPQEARLQIFAGNNSTGTLLFTSSTGSSTGPLATVTDTGAISAINGINQYDELYVQVQWRSGAVTPASSAWTFDTFTISGNVVAVPEPSALCLGGIGLLVLFRRKRG
jgi:hypothetical protein